MANIKRFHVWSVDWFERTTRGIEWKFEVIESKYKKDRLVLLLSLRGIQCRSEFYVVKNRHFHKHITKGL